MNRRTRNEENPGSQSWRESLARQIESDKIGDAGRAVLLSRHDPDAAFDALASAFFIELSARPKAICGHRILAAVGSGMMLLSVVSAHYSGSHWTPDDFVLLIATPTLSLLTGVMLMAIGLTPWETRTRRRRLGEAILLLAPRVSDPAVALNVSLDAARVAGYEKLIPLLERLSPNDTARLDEGAIGRLREIASAADERHADARLSIAAFLVLSERAKHDTGLRLDLRFNARIARVSLRPTLSEHVRTAADEYLRAAGVLKP